MYKGMKVARQMLHLSLAYVSKRLGVDYSELDRFENGKGYLNLLSLQEMCNIYGDGVLNFVSNYEKSDIEKLKIFFDKNIKD